MELPPAPYPEDFHASLNSYLEIILRVTDKDGLTAESSVLLQPALVKVVMDTYPAGLELLVDEEPVVAFQEVWSWSEHDLLLQAENQPPYVFVSWSDGVTAPERTVTLNATDLSYIANFCIQDGGPCDSETGMCCNATCNTNGKCGLDGEEEVFSTASTPEETEATTAPVDTNLDPEDQGSSPSLGLEQEDVTDSTDITPDPRKGMSLAGEAVLILAVLFSVSGIAYFLLYTRGKKEDARSIPPITSAASKLGFVDVEKLSTDGDSSSDDGNRVRQTISLAR